MRCLKLPVVAAALLTLLANAQCVARCAATACDLPTSSSTHLPPCHRHAPPRSSPCTSAPFVVDTRTHPLPQIGAHAARAVLADAEPAPPAVWRPIAQPHPSPPPIDSGPPSFRILRI